MDTWCLTHICARGIRYIVRQRSSALLWLCLVTCMLSSRCMQGLDDYTSTYPIYTGTGYMHNNGAGKVLVQSERLDIEQYTRCTLMQCRLIIHWTGSCVSQAYICLAKGFYKAIT